MAAFTSILMGVGLALSAAGTAVGMVGAQKQAKAQKQQAQMQAAAIEEQRKAEEVRRKQMQMDARRKRMAVVREMQLARATALNNATSQGAGGGSALPGAYGGITSQGNSQTTGINAAEAFGNRIFDHNANVSQYYQQAAMFGGKAADAGTLQSIGGGIQSLGGSVYKAAGTFGQIGGYA